MPKIITASGEELSALPDIPKVKSVHPWGSKIMIDGINNKELLHTKLHVPDEIDVGDFAAQAYIIELGPKVPEDCGLKVGQRINWSGTGVPVKDPRQDRRVRAMIEIHQIIAVIEEESGLEL